MSSDLKPQNAKGYECFVKKNKTIRFSPEREAVFREARKNWTKKS
jgi:hypothetical protein